MGTVSALHGMLASNFRVLESRANCGSPGDRNRVPNTLVRRGVLKYPCCRELTMINIKSSKALSPSELETKYEPKVAAKFIGFNNLCPGGLEPTSVGSIKFCADMLREDVKRDMCAAYIFGASSPDEIQFIKLLRDE